MSINSRIPGFHKLSIDERLAKIKEIVDLTDKEISILKSAKSQVTIENIIGVMTTPIGLATNFLVDGKDKKLTTKFDLGVREGIKQDNQPKLLTHEPGKTQI